AVIAAPATPIIAIAAFAERSAVVEIALRAPLELTLVIPGTSVPVLVSPPLSHVARPFLGCVPSPIRRIRARIAASALSGRRIAAKRVEAVRSGRCAGETTGGADPCGACQLRRREARART